MNKDSLIIYFAGYSKNNIIEDYVVYYIKELSLFADVYYCADCNINEFELNKLSNYVKKSIAYRHKKRSLKAPFNVSFAE